MKRILEPAVKTVIRPACGTLLAALILSACGPSVSAPGETAKTDDGLTGAWRSQIRFSSGAFAPVKDLEFMYVFNAGGTLTESSNYDAAPPVPPAYGVWRSMGVGRFEAKYLFYITAPPKKFEEITSGSGWGPAGFGEFIERIEVSKDGRTFKSTIDYTAFDPQGKPVEGGGKATGSGMRIAF